MREQILKNLIPIKQVACTRLRSKGLAVMITHLVSLTTDCSEDSSTWLSEQAATLENAVGQNRAQCRVMRCLV